MVQDPAVIAIAPGAAFLLTTVLTAIILQTVVFYRIQDIPNDRSLHSRPIPRIGGVSLWGGAIIGFSALDRADLWHLFLPIALLAIVSFSDDVRGLSARVRLLTHVCAATFFVVTALGTAMPILCQMTLALAIIWAINLYNFMDGSDGLAGGMAVVGFSAYGVAALLAQRSDLAVFSFSIAASAFAFLLYNFHPAKVFLGDAGSIPLGFAAGSLGLLGWNRGIWPLWFPLMVFSPFIVDATLTLAKRFIRREKVWEGHRDHYYQRMVRMGWGHRRTALSEYVLMICAGSSALAGLRWTQSMQLILLFAWALVYLGLAFSLDRAWQRYQATQTNAD